MDNELKAFLNRDFKDIQNKVIGDICIYLNNKFDKIIIDYTEKAFLIKGEDTQQREDCKKLINEIINYATTA